MASAQVVETSVTNNSPSQDSNHPDDLFQPRYNYSDAKQVTSTVDDFIPSTWESSDLFSTRPIFYLQYFGFFTLGANCPDTVPFQWLAVFPEDCTIQPFNNWCEIVVKVSCQMQKSQWYIPLSLTSQVQGPYCKLWTAFFRHHFMAWVRCTRAMNWSEKKKSRCRHV